MTPLRPTREQLEAARSRTIPDVIAPGLDILFCGINPGLYSAAIGCHFGRPGNRFWPVLHRAGFTDRLLSPPEQRRLLGYGCGITNLVARGTRSAAELSRSELQAGAAKLRRKLRRYRPRVLAVVGIDAFRKAFDDPKAAIGRQPTLVEDVALWVLPNPSGLNAHYQAASLVEHFRTVRRALGRGARSGEVV